MKELIEFIAQSLTSNPEAVKVTEEDEGDQIVIRLEVAPEDKGKVIGRQGARGPGHAGPAPCRGRQGRHPGSPGDCLVRDNPGGADLGLALEMPPGQIHPQPGRSRNRPTVAFWSAA